MLYQLSFKWLSPQDWIRTNNTRSIRHLQCHAKYLKRGEIATSVTYSWITRGHFCPFGIEPNLTEGTDVFTAPYLIFKMRKNWQQRCLFQSQFEGTVIFTIRKWARLDLNQRAFYRTDLQSAAFNLSATYPNNRRINRKHTIYSCTLTR